MARPPAAPVRYGSRYAAGPTTPPHPACPACTAPLPAGRARYCSDACKQRAYRLRQRAIAAPDLTALAATLRRLGELAVHTVYECPTCDERYLGEQRCPDCHHFCRALGLGGPCPDCDRPVLIAELLGPEVARSSAPAHAPRCQRWPDGAEDAWLPVRSPRPPRTPTRASLWRCGQRSGRCRTSPQARRRR